MAGYWIKMREDLHEDPAVLWMAQQLNCRPETVVGYCHRIWGLLSRQTRDGCLPGVKLLSLGNVLGLPGFPELMCRAGWLEYDDTEPEWPVINVPKFERHLSESAKKRAEEAEKKRKQRSPNCPQKQGTNVPGHRGPEEKRREEKSKNKKPSVSFVRHTKNGGYPQEFEAFWDAYPKRGGQRRGKSATYQLWRKLPVVDLPQLETAARHYSASQEARDGFARDPERFLKKDWWRDWVDGSTTRAVAKWEVPDI